MPGMWELPLNSGTPRVLIWGSLSVALLQHYCFFLSLIRPRCPSHNASKSASRGRKECFLPLNQKAHTLHQKTPVGERQRSSEGKKSGSLAVYGAAREAVRALHLTALLSEPSLHPGTIPRCHLQLWCELILPSNPRLMWAGRKQRPLWTRRDVRRCNKSQMCCS